MSECIIYYNDLNHYNNPVFVTKGTSCWLKKDMKNEMTDTFFNLNWYQKKIFQSIGIIEIHAAPSLQNVFDKSKLIP